MTLRIATTAVVHTIAVVSHTRYFRFSPQDSPSHAARSFTFRDRARGGCQRARSFDSRVIVSRPSAVGRDEIVILFALCKFGSMLLCADPCNPKIDASNRNDGGRTHDRRRFSYSLFSVLPRGGSKVAVSCPVLPSKF